jgi:protein TonB
MTVAKPCGPFDERTRVLVRLGLAVLLSLALHLALIFSVRVGVVAPHARPEHFLQVRLTTRDQAGRPSRPAAEGRQPVLVHARNEPAPTPKPEPELAPTPSPKPAEPKPVAPSPPGPQPAEVGSAKPEVPKESAGATGGGLPPPPDYYPAVEVDEHPVLVSGGQPVYPDKAARDSIKGDVTVLMLLNENGAADDVTVIDAQPPGYAFEDAVIAWLRKARFKPAMRKGKAVKARVVYHVTFEP